MAVLQDQLIATVNNIYEDMQQIHALLGTVSMHVNSYTQLVGGTVLAALPTTALTAAGALGTADPTPVATNPIDTRLISSLKISNSSYDIGVMVAILQQFIALFNGETVTQQTFALAELAKANAD